MLICDVQNLAQTWRFDGNEVSRNERIAYPNVSKRIDRRLTGVWNLR